MCLAVPMRIVAIEGVTARCEAKGVERRVSLTLLQYEGLAPGDLVMVHAGYAIQTVTEQDASETWALLDEVLAADGLDAAQELGDEIPRSVASQGSC